MCQRVLRSAGPHDVTLRGNYPPKSYDQESGVAHSSLFPGCSRLSWPRILGSLGPIALDQVPPIGYVVVVSPEKLRSAITTSKPHQQTLSSLLMVLFTNAALLASAEICEASSPKVTLGPRLVMKFPPYVT